MNNFTASILIIASVGIFFGYINPTYGGRTGYLELERRSIVELREEKDRYAEALEKTKEIERARTGLLEKYNNISIEDRTRLEKLLPDHIDSVRLIIDINNIASGYGMTLTNISISESGVSGFEESNEAIGPQEERFRAVEFRFGITGAYDEFRAFLFDLERSLRLVDVRTVTFGADEEEYDYSITLVTYRLVPEQNENL
ncbi:MAG: hypothetical protein Q8Q13_00520 [bacterium]|nr:hypothetical protein [bacterium]